MAESLVALRKAKGLTQEQLGALLAARLSQIVPPGYGQKKISRFESGDATPTTEELRALATELGVDEQVVSIAIKAGGPNEAATVFGQIGLPEIRRSLMAVCCLGRSRAQGLDETFTVMRTAIEQRNLSMCVFVPYPNTLHLPAFGDHAETLAGYYRKIRKSVSDANLIFKNGIGDDCSKRLALYFPRAEFARSAVVLIPPIFRQYSLTLEESTTNKLTKTLLEWTPSGERDTSRPILATGVHSLDEQIDAWEALFGDVLPHWIATNELLAQDGYWERVR